MKAFDPHCLHGSRAAVQHFASFVIRHYNVSYSVRLDFTIHTFHAFHRDVIVSGSSLAQDRGRLEAKIEALTSEVSYLKKQLEVRTGKFLWAVFLV